MVSFTYLNKFYVKCERKISSFWLHGVCQIQGPLNSVFFLFAQHVAFKKEASEDTVNKLEL